MMMLPPRMTNDLRLLFFFFRGHVGVGTFGDGRAERVEMLELLVGTGVTGSSPDSNAVLGVRDGVRDESGTHRF